MSAIDSRALDLAILFAIPLAQALINSAWIYSPYTWLDPWYYYGYGMNYTDPSYLYFYYKVSRLPWILLQYSVRHLFDPVTANWVLQIGTLWLAAASLYLAFGRLLGRSAGFLGAAFFVANAFTHANGGADYQNQLGGPLYALTWWLTVRAGQDGGRPAHVFLAGLAAALTVHSNIVFVNLLPPLVACYVMVYRQNSAAWPNVLSALVFSIAGMAVATVALGLINWSVGRQFLFFMPQLQMVTSFVADNSYQKSWWRPWNTGWFWTTRYLGPLFGSGLVALLLLASLSLQKRSWDAKDQNVALLAGGGLFSLAFWIVWQNAGHTALDHDYFAYPLALPLTGVMAAAAYRWFAGPMTGWSGLAFKLAVLAVALSPWLAFETLHLDVYNKGQSVVFTALFFGAVGLLAWLLGRFTIVSVLVFGLFVSGYTAGVVSARKFTISACQADRMIFKTIDRSHRYLKTFGYPHAKVLVWADLDETAPLGANCAATVPAMLMKSFGSALTSTGYGYVAAPWEANTLADIKPERFAEIAATGALAVYATNQEARVASLVRAFEANGGVVTPRGQMGMGAGDLRVMLYVMEVAKRSP